MVQCKAKSKQSQERCKRQAHPGMEVCVMHGGKSLIGPAHPNYRTGKYSKLLPSRMTEHLLEARSDPDLLAMGDEIAVVDARIADVMKRVDKGESSSLWYQLRTAHREMQEARRAKDPDQLALKLNEVGDLIEKGHADYACWNDVLGLIEQRRRLVESERKRMIELKMSLSYDEALVYAQNVLESVKRHVKDRDALAAIAADLRSVVGVVGRLPSPS